MKTFLFNLWKIYNTIKKYITNFYVLIMLSIVIGLITWDLFYGFVALFLLFSVNILFMLLKYLKRFIFKQGMYQTRTLRIRKGGRRPFPFITVPSLRFMVKDNSFSITKYFKFTYTALYDMGDINQLSVNKLFGHSVGLNHHKESYRFGWRPSNDLKNIVIFKYEYIDGKRLFTPITEVEPNKMYRYEIRFDLKNGLVRYVVSYGTDSVVLDTTRLGFDIKHKLITVGYSLGLYFGGKKPAPNDIIIFERSNIGEKRTKS